MPMAQPDPFSGQSIFCPFCMGLNGSGPKMPARAKRADPLDWTHIVTPTWQAEKKCFILFS